MHPTGHNYFLLLRELQIVEFFLIELQLYLATHPADKRAIKQFNQYSRYLKKIIDQYEHQYGPLFQYGLSKLPLTESAWVNQPWPWEIDYPPIHHREYSLMR